MIVKILITVLV